jgi:hypothetical protein
MIDTYATVRTIISAPPLQNAVSHTTAIGERHSSSCSRSALVTHGILQRWRAYDCTHCIIVIFEGGGVNNSLTLQRKQQRYRIEKSAFTYYPLSHTDCSNFNNFIG